MALPDLGSMKPDQLSKLTPLQLLRYNSPLPQDDPDNPYVHQEYPKYLFALSKDGNNAISAVAKDETEELELREQGYRGSLLDWGIITHPEVPKYSAGVNVNIVLSADQKKAVKSAPAPAK